MIRFDTQSDKCQALTPYLVVKDGDAMLEFYKKAFGATEEMVARVPDSKLIMHASLRIGGSAFFLNDEFPDQGALSPLTTGASPSTSIHMQLAEGIDELFKQAVAAGAKPVMEPADMFWGDRFAVVVDPSGHKWSMGMAIPNPPQVSKEELREQLGVS